MKRKKRLRLGMPVTEGVISIFIPVTVDAR